MKFYRVVCNVFFLFVGISVYLVFENLGKQADPAGFVREIRLKNLRKFLLTRTIHASRARGIVRANPPTPTITITQSKTPQIIPDGSQVTTCAGVSHKSWLTKRAGVSPSN